MNTSKFDVTIDFFAIKDAVVIRADITEEISTLYTADVYVRVDEQVDTESLLNTYATISVNIDDTHWRYFSGIIESARFENIISTHDNTERSILYIKVVPTFSRTIYKKRYRSFQNQSTIDIILTVLKENSIADVKLDLQNRDRDIRDFCVQYGESDFHFMSRLMEEEGLFYYFRHDDGKDILYISDLSQAGPQIERELRIRKYTTSVTITPDSVYNVAFSDSIGTQQINTYSYDYQKAEVITGTYSQIQKTKQNL